MAIEKRWLGPHPKACEVCGASLEGRGFVDGATRMGPWAIMCVFCHAQEEVGVGIGPGLGQLYDASGKKIGG